MNSIFKTFVLSVLVAAQVHFAYAQTASILPPAKTTFNDANGKPLVSGTIDFYIPGTTTRKTTWQDAAETIPNANPVVLDAAGRALILGSGDYRQIVKDRLNNIIWDQVTSSAGSGGGGSSSIGDGNNVGSIIPWPGFTPPQSYLFTYGQEISRTTYAIFLNTITLIQNATCTSGNATLTAIVDTSQLNVGAAVEAACVPANSVIVSKTINSVTLNNLALVSVTNSTRFFPWGNGNGITTFNVPDLRGIYLPGRNNMGGAASANITNPSYTDPNSINGSGGHQTTTLIVDNLPAYTPAGTVSVTSANTVVQSSTSTLTSAVGGGAVTALITAAASVGSVGSSGTLTGTPQGGVSTPTVVLPPSKTINYVIKVLPNVTSTSTVVTSIGGMTGDLICGTGIICAANTISSIGTTLTVATTPITGAVVNGLLFNNAGVLGSTNNVNSAVAITSGGGAPSFSTTLPNGLALGTPASATLTNATGLPVTTGISGLGTNVATFLATPNSANLNGAVTDDTGSGALVFANTPTLVTPILGAATATSINKVAITAPASSATLTIPDGVTLTGPAASGTAMTLGNSETVTGVKTFGSAGAVGRLRVAGTTSGSTIIDAQAVASGTLSLPAITDTLIGRATTDTLTNKTLNSTGTGNVLQVSGVTVSAGQYPGEPTTGNATAGNTGEYLQNIGALVNIPTTNVDATIATITLTAGDWDVDLIMNFVPAATTSVSKYTTSLSTTSALDTTTGRFWQQTQTAFVSAGGNFTAVIPPYRFSVAGSTTINAIAQVTFTVSTIAANALLRARRVR